MGLELEHGAGRLVGQFGLAGQLWGGELAGAFEEQHGPLPHIQEVDLGVLTGVGFSVHEIASDCSFSATGNTSGWSLPPVCESDRSW
ncbi:hypothetical protein GCM10009754_87650 [Amycolatopsis minnesotensis]|uniref:Uncharacterized protein n=1 Tax=Amycolatopsis minnesotensis TaxID=337894 RepID=A0ABN2SYU1_9PSEU